MSYTPRRQIIVSSLADVLAKLTISGSPEMIIVPDNTVVVIDNSSATPWELGARTFSLGNNSALEPANKFNDYIIGDNLLVDIDNSTASYIGALRLFPNGANGSIRVTSSAIISDTLFAGSTPVALDNATYVGMRNCTFFGTTGVITNTGTSGILDISNFRTTTSPFFVQGGIQVTSGSLDTLIINNIDVTMNTGKKFIEVSGGSPAAINNVIISNGKYVGAQADFISGLGDYPQLTYTVNNILGYPDTPNILPSTNVTTTYTIDPLTDKFVTCIGEFTITLPPCSGLSGFNFYIKNKGEDLITIEPSGSDTIEYETSIGLIQNNSFHVVCDGTGWFII